MTNTIKLRGLEPWDFSSSKFRVNVVTPSRLDWQTRGLHQRNLGPDLRSFLLNLDLLKFQTFMRRAVPTTNRLRRLEASDFHLAFSHVQNVLNTR